MQNLEQNYIEFIKWLLDNQDMQTWFISLSSLDQEQKLLELRNTAIRLSASQENDETVKMIANLTDEDTYNSIRAVLLAELNRR